jgi:hypothetical protein
VYRSVLMSGVTALAATTPDDGWIGSWSPGIGDPTVAGWITVFAYFTAAALCWRVYRHRLARAGHSSVPGFALVVLPWVLALLGRRRHLDRVGVEVRARALWLGLTVLLLFLGINKQLDLQTVITEVGRMAAGAGGWYEERHLVQLAFIGLVIVAGAWALRAVWLLARGNIAELRAVLLGMVFLLCFVAIRAASFHHVDLLLGHSLAGLRLNSILELGGISVIAVGAIVNGALAPRPAGHRARPRAQTTATATATATATPAKKGRGPSDPRPRG